MKKVWGAEKDSVDFRDKIWYAIASGIDPKTLSEILGHTNASFTLDTNAYVTEETQKRAALIVGDFMDDIVIR